MRRSAWFGMTLWGVVAGCGSVGGSSHDGGLDGRPSDAGKRDTREVRDTSASDTRPDLGGADRVPIDAVSTDGMQRDAHGTDAVTTDGPRTDAATSDAHRTDASTSDAAHSDATGASDAGAGSDAGPPKSGVCGTLIDLGTLPGDKESRATAINDVGDVVGTSGANAFFWHGGTMSLVSTFGSATNDGTYTPTGDPLAVNHSGQIAGMAFVAPYKYSAPKYYPVVWVRGLTGGPTPVPLPGWGVGQATAINDVGQVIGTSQVCTDTTVCNGIPKRMHGFFWQNGTTVDVGTLGGYGTATSPVVTYDSKLVALNQAGQAVGSSLTASGSTHAALWADGQLKDLGTLGGAWSAAYAIDETGAVFGISKGTDGQLHAFLWAAGIMTDRGVIPDLAGLAVNHLGWMIGQTTTQGVFWKDGTTTTLPMQVWALNDAGEVACTSGNDLVVWQGGVTTNLGNLGGKDMEPVAIDNAGRIIGSCTTATGEYHGFLFQPGACQH